MKGYFMKDKFKSFLKFQWKELINGEEKIIKSEDFENQNLILENIQNIKKITENRYFALVKSVEDKNFRLISIQENQISKYNKIFKFSYEVFENTFILESTLKWAEHYFIFYIIKNYSNYFNSLGELSHFIWAHQYSIYYAPYVENIENNIHLKYWDDLVKMIRAICEKHESGLGNYKLSYLDSWLFKKPKMLKTLFNNLSIVENIINDSQTKQIIKDLFDLLVDLINHILLKESQKISLEFPLEKIKEDLLLPRTSRDQKILIIPDFLYHTSQTPYWEHFLKLMVEEINFSETFSTFNILKNCFYGKGYYFNSLQYSKSYKNWFDQNVEELKKYNYEIEAQINVKKSFFENFYEQSFWLTMEKQLAPFTQKYKVIYNLDDYLNYQKDLEQFSPEINKWKEKIDKLD